VACDPCNVYDNNYLGEKESQGIDTRAPLAYIYIYIYIYIYSFESPCIYIQGDSKQPDVFEI